MITTYIKLGAATAARHQSPAASGDDLIARVAAGDKLAMHSLFARHRTSVYRWLLRFVRDQAAAEDLLSEVFLDVWQQADQFEGTLLGVDVADVHCPLQGALGRSPPNRRRAGRNDRSHRCRPGE